MPLKNPIGALHPLKQKGVMEVRDSRNSRTAVFASVPPLPLAE
jgi:hypothetical protein